MQERRKERAETDIGENDYSEYMIDNDISPEEQVFRRFDSKRSYRHQALDIPRPETPVITGRTGTGSMSVISSTYTLPTHLPPPTTAEGFLDRKQEFMGGGRRSTVRTWKTYYTVLCGQLLCFFKDKKSFLIQNAAKSPVSILGAKCYVPKDYLKKKFVFRLETADNSQFLFEASNDIKRNEWIKKISFAANLPPHMQLMGMDGDYDDFQVHGREKRYESASSIKYDDLDDTEEPLYQDVEQNIESVSNPIYAVPHEEMKRTFSITSEESYTDEAFESAKSSFSNQSSLKRGKIAFPFTHKYLHMFNNDPMYTFTS